MTRDQHESNKKKVKLTKDLQGEKSLHFKAPTKTSLFTPTTWTPTNHPPPQGTRTWPSSISLLRPTYHHSRPFSLWTWNHTKWNELNCGAWYGQVRWVLYGRVPRDYTIHPSFSLHCFTGFLWRYCRVSGFVGIPTRKINIKEVGQHCRRNRRHAVRQDRLWRIYLLLLTIIGRSP